MTLAEYFRMKDAPSMSSFSFAARVSLQTVRNAVKGYRVKNYETAKKISEATRLHPTLQPLVSIKELCE